MHPGAPPPGASTVTRRLLEQAEREPGRPAIVAPEGVWTYAQLAERVQAVADAIGRREQVPVVAIHGASSAGFIAALAAVMEAGAAALPIDASLPVLRKRKMMEVAGAGVVIDVAAAALEVPRACHVWRMDGATGRMVEGARGAIDIAGGLPRERFDDAAYVFLTSGTTGEPKAIVGRRSSLDHFVGWQRVRFGIGPDDRVGQFTSLSFDPCLREIFVALTSGATLQIQPAGARQSAEQMLRWIGSAGTSVVHAVPTLARHWLRATESSPLVLPSVRITFFAGEPLDRGLVTAWRAVATNSRIVNLYGPTETTLARFHWTVPDEAALAAYQDPLPVGSPIDSTAARVLDAARREVAAGAIGEIFIDTAFPSYGYLDEAMTRDKFVAVDGVEPQHGVSLFRTGDLGYYDARGDLVVVGRVDAQVKIAGVRVNPAEVAACLRAAPGVAAAVVGTERAGDRTQLIAWYVVAPGQRVEVAALRRHLAERLVAAMVPARFIAVGALPVTSNGKVDLVALRGALRDAGDEGIGEAPESELQKLVCGAWSEVLGIDQVGLDQDYYMLGGDSLQASEIASRLAKRSGRAIDAGDVLEHATPRRLADTLERGAIAVQADDPVRSIRSGGRTSPISARQRAYRAVCMAGDRFTWCVLSRILPLARRVERAELTRAVDAVLRRRDALRMRFPALWERGEVELLSLEECDARDVPVELVDLSEHTYEASVERCMQLRAQGSRVELDVASWPLFRLARVRCADRDALILWAHHLVVDGPSLNMVADDLLCVLDEPARPLERGAAEADHIDYVEQTLQVSEPSTAAARAYWRGLLQGAPATCLPEVRTEHSSARGMLFTLPLPPELVSRVLARSRARACTPFVFLLGAFLQAAARYVGRSDLSAIVPVQIRPGDAFARTVGLFFSQLVVRIDTSRIQGTREDWTQELSRQIRDGQRHSSYEFDQRLVDLGIDLRQYDYPLTTLMFNLNQVSARQTYDAATPLGHHALGRDLRFQLQGELQQKGDELWMGLLYRAGVFGTRDIERFASEMMETAVELASSGSTDS